MPVEIKEASIQHLGKLYEIEIKCFQKEAFTKQQIAYLLTDCNSVGLIAKSNGEVAGFAIGKIYRDKKSSTGHTLTIDVSPKYRRKGIGLKLLQGIERIFQETGAKVCFLEAREDNITALSLYRRHGYKEAGKLKNYYGNTNGLYLKKALT